MTPPNTNANNEVTIINTSYVASNGIKTSEEAMINPKIKLKNPAL